jgi:hypothetical protein
MINGRSYSPTMMELEKLNNDSIVYMYTPSYFNYLDDSSINCKITHLPLETDDRIFQEQLRNRLRYTFDKDTLTISEYFFVHGHYDFLPSYEKTDTSISIILTELLIADTTHFKETKEVWTTDVSIAYPADIITKLHIDIEDTVKSIYYKKQKIK